MSFEYRFEPPNFNDFDSELELFDDDIIDYDYEEFLSDVEEHLCEERFQKWSIEKAYKRRLDYEQHSNY